MKKDTLKNGDLFVERYLNPEELERFGLETKLSISCGIMANDLVLKDRVKTIRVREEPGAKTYSVWFKSGGTIELVVNDKGELELIDSYGCDVSFAWNRVEIYSHQPNPNSPRYKGADPDYEGPVNSREMFFGVFQNAGPDVSDPEDDTLH